MKITKGGNHNPLIEEGQATQWPKVKVQNIKQTTKDWATRIPLKTGGEIMCSESLAVPVLLVTPGRRVTVNWHEHHLIWKSCASQMVPPHKVSYKQHQSLNSICPRTLSIIHIFLLQHCNFGDGLTKAFSFRIHIL